MGRTDDAYRPPQNFRRNAGECILVVQNTNTTWRLTTPVNEVTGIRHPHQVASVFRLDRRLKPATPFITAPTIDTTSFKNSIYIART